VAADGEFVEVVAALLRGETVTRDGPSLAVRGARLDGLHHEARFSRADTERQIRLVRDEARRAGTAPVLEALVQVVTVTDDRPAAVASISDRLPGTTPEDVAAAPFILIGTHEQMAAQWRA
jgi:alkanesulfonate monooxygenase SsuD/methylene tetrahydromethanopterin reductase-like flavin-dependent oxidoreductase (luciferase family)